MAALCGRTHSTSLRPALPSLNLKTRVPSLKTRVMSLKTRVRVWKPEFRVWKGESESENPSYEFENRVRVWKPELWVWKPEFRFWKPEYEGQEYKDMYDIVKNLLAYPQTGLGELMSLPQHPQLAGEGAGCRGLHVDWQLRTIRELVFWYRFLIRQTICHYCG
jgi:hypothetical protein